MNIDKEKAMEVSEELRGIVAQSIGYMLEKHGDGTTRGAFTVASGAMTALLEALAKCIVVFPRSLHQQLTTDVVNSLVSMRKITDTAFQSMLEEKDNADRSS